MRRSAGSVLLALATLLLAAWAGVQALAVRSTEPRASAIPGELRARDAPLAGGSEARVAAVPAGLRRPIEPPGEAMPSRSRVRVHGRVRSAGRAAADLDLEFRAVDGGAGDWDLTDERGAYEVELRPGRYAVESDEAAPGVAGTLQVPAGCSEIALDVELELRAGGGR